MREQAAIWLAPAFLAGVLAVQWMPVLPTQGWLLPVLVLSAWLAWSSVQARGVAFLLLGAAWAACCGVRAMESRLPRELEGRDLSVTGTVSGLPQVRAEATRFMLTVERAAVGDEPVALDGRLRLAWYAAGGKAVPAIVPCARWHLTLRLKRPRGLVNPGGGDGERSALERGIVATGYVRDDASNRSTGVRMFCVDGWRAAIADGIERRVADVRSAALLRAFAIGDTRGLTQRDWELARANGASHLIAISGFHVGVAAVAGVWLARLAYACWPGFGLRVPRRQVQALAALLCAALYSALAGFGLPTVRTLLMIAVVALARCSRRHVSSAQALALALLAMLAADPLAVLSAGFWLSFAGVAFLIYSLSPRAQGWRGALRELTLAQAVMAVALLPLSLWFFGGASLVGALSNLLAVPLVSFLVVPLTLFGTALLLMAPPLAGPVLVAAGWLCAGLWWLFERMAGWPGAQVYVPAARPWALGLALLGAGWMLLPRGTPMRWLGALLFLPLAWPPVQRPQPGAFRLWMLDVGQGLAVVLRTREHALVFDAGARFPSDFDLGEAAVLPSLRALGIARLDLLVVSHADNDHAGGAPAVAQAHPAAARLGGEPERMPIATVPCAAGQSWNWDGVHFRMLGPAARAAAARGNDRSCVLLAEGTGGRVLLTGDIGLPAERGLPAAVGTGPPLVLQVPHHGSRTSSGPDLVRGLAPVLALVSAGWRNRFGHPHPLVAQRYAAFRVPMLNTAEQGAIEVDFPADAPPHMVRAWRRHRLRYWRE